MWSSDALSCSEMVQAKGCQETQPERKEYTQDAFLKYNCGNAAAARPTHLAKRRIIGTLPAPCLVARGTGDADTHLSPAERSSAL